MGVSVRVVFIANMANIAHSICYHRRVSAEPRRRRCRQSQDTCMAIYAWAHTAAHS